MSAARPVLFHTVDSRFPIGTAAVLLNDEYFDAVLVHEGPNSAGVGRSETNSTGDITNDQ